MPLRYCITTIIEDNSQWNFKSLNSDLTSEGAGTFNCVYLKIGQVNGQVGQVKNEV